MKQMVKKEEAVSPVVGVMLMLVVTIIIAAVVSAFAGGLAGGTTKAPQASIVAKEIVVNEAYDAINNNTNPDPVSGKCSDVYVVFEHMGGDGINLNDIEIHLGALKYPNEKTAISNAKNPSTNTTLTGSKADIQSLFSRNWSVYLEGYPDKASLIAPGSKFVLHADYVRDMPDNYIWNKISWRPEIAAGAFSVDAGDYLTYDIIDKASQKSIASGQIRVPDFAVKSS
ncbi:MAG: type IV pilin N-terminal domain-containing protein [Methanomicrobiales archaeon]|nr:type IV pilin N-terminal domain-containing protein [Methanomicrobiales archaeon]